LIRKMLEWADKLKKMPADDKIAVIFGALLGVLFAVLLSFWIGDLFRDVQVPIWPSGGRVKAPPTISVAPLIVGVLGFILAFFCIQVMVSMKSDLRKILPPYGPV